MENLSNNTLSSKRRFTFFGLLKVIFVLAILYLVFFSFYFPVKQLKVFNSTYSDSLLFKGEEKEIIKDDSIADLKIKEAFLQSRLIMAKTDSISFSVDLKDSLLLLEIRGVIVHEAKISKIEISRFFSRVENDALINYLSKPLKVDHKLATIEKEPIFIKKAPKDTIEAATQIFTPDTLANEVICINMEFDKNLFLEISQSEEKPQFNNLWFLINKRSKNVVQVAKNSISFKEPFYTPKILIEVPKDDIKSIYRALPYKPQMALNL